MKNSEANYSALIHKGSLIALAGFVLSGPASFILVRMVRPQPVWTSASVFVANYHIIQDIPYYFGFMLVAGMLMVTAGHYLKSSADVSKVNKIYLIQSLCWVIIFGTLISFNYICQTTFVRGLILNYDPKLDLLLEGFSMANPLSLCWAIEMWGYAALGVSTWFGAAYYEGRHRIIQLLMIANGVVSLGSAVWTIIDSDWTMTNAGLAGYFFWNVLMIALMIFIARQSRKA